MSKVVVQKMHFRNVNCLILFEIKINWQMEPQSSTEEMYDLKKIHSTGVTINAYWLYFYQVHGWILKGYSDLAAHLIGH